MPQVEWGGVISLFRLLYVCPDSTKRTRETDKTHQTVPGPPPLPQWGYDRPKQTCTRSAHCWSKPSQPWPKAAQLSSKTGQATKCSKKLRVTWAKIDPYPTPSQTAIQPLTLYTLGQLVHGLAYLAHMSKKVSPLKFSSHHTFQVVIKPLSQEPCFVKFRQISIKIIVA